MRIQSTPCPLAYKYVKGAKVADKRHNCAPSHFWSPDQIKAWLDDPDRRYPMVQVYTPPCEYGKPESAHWRSEKRGDGYAGRMERVSCDGPDGRCVRAAMCHLPTCDCLQCVTDRITADKRQEVA